MFWSVFPQSDLKLLSFPLFLSFIPIFIFLSSIVLLKSLCLCVLLNIPFYQGIHRRDFFHDSTLDLGVRIQFILCFAAQTASTLLDYPSKNSRIVEYMCALKFPEHWTRIAFQTVCNVTNHAHRAAS